jgi:hypothetical protein
MVSQRNKGWIMEVNTKGGVIEVNLDNQEDYNKAREAIDDLLDSIPDLIAAGVNSFIDANEAIRPEENVSVDFWPYYGSNLDIEEPSLHVTLWPINGDSGDCININFPLWDVVKKAVIDEDAEPMRIAASELRKMADYIDENTNK